MLRFKIAVQLTQAKRFAGVVPSEYRFEFGTSRQTGGCRVSFRRIGRTGPDSWIYFARSAAAEMNSGRALFAFLKVGPVAALSLYSDPSNSITTPGTAIWRVR
jgi:hypothetical protein